MAALSVANVAETEHALSAPLNYAEAIYKANLEMRGFYQEVVRVVLLDSQLRCVVKVEVLKGTVNQSVGYPREILRPAITHPSFGFVVLARDTSVSKRLDSCETASLDTRRCVFCERTNDCLPLCSLRQLG